MKKITLSLVFAIGFCATSFSQLNNGIIEGYFTVIVGQPTTFTVTENAECDTCYEWTVNNEANSKKDKANGTLKLVSSEKGKTITVEATAPGVFIINVMYSNEKGYRVASYKGYIVNPKQETSITLLDESKKLNN
jgi:hypothetical protein